MIKYMRTAAITAAVVMGCVSCGDVSRTSRAPVNLLVTALTAGSSNTLLSDVVVMKTAPAPCSTTAPCPTIVDDNGTASLSAPMKNTTVGPTTNNQVTIHRYHVEFARADGRNTPGIDVPYGFDGAVTATLAGNGTASLSFELVRHVAKQESPLAQLVSSPNIIYTIATVTFYGTDAVGNDVSASGTISVNFGNFADQ